MIPAAVESLCREHGLPLGTQPENLAALRLHQWGLAPLAQYRVGRYRLDFAFPAHLVAIEIDGPHHHRPDVALRDALRDAHLRSLGWIILRVNTGDTFEEQIARASSLIHALTDKDN